MSRTDLDPATLANSLRTKAGDGSMEWVYEPIQASVLLDIADMLDEKAKLREKVQRQADELTALRKAIEQRNSELRPWKRQAERFVAENAKLRELVRDYHRYEHEDCHSCRYINECRADESGRCIAPMRLGERYRELGVEVDG